METLLDPAAWAATTFAACDLHDARRTRRAVAVAERLAGQADASLPAALGAPAMLKAAYRLLHADGVTVDALTAPHRAQTRQAASAPGTTLLVQDTTELDYTAHRAVADLGPIGNGRGRGYLLQSVLAVRPDDGAVQGLAALVPFLRQPQADRGTRAADRRQRARESDIWGATAAAIGTPPAGTTWVHVGDRGADVFTFFQACRATGSDLLVRVTQDRCAMGADGTATHILQAARALPAVAHRSHALAARRRVPARTATLSLAWTALTVRPPADVRGQEPLPAWVVRVWEAAPPPGVEPLEWVLLTTVPVADTSDAWERVGWYERRWLVEEYHRCLKTGCRVEASQLQDRAALWRLLGLCAPTAVRLLQLRQAARTDPAQPAAAALPAAVIAVVAAKTRHPAAGMTVGQCWRLIARLGGHQGRRGDGEPGWETLWKGWRTVSLLVEGVHLAPPCPRREMWVKVRTFSPGRIGSQSPLDAPGDSNKEGIESDAERISSGAISRPAGKLFAGFLATIGSDGKPQVNPVWFIADAGHVYLSVKPETVKYRNLRANPAVAMAIGDPGSPGRYVEVRGEVILFELYETLEWVNVLAHKYTGADFIGGLDGEPLQSHHPDRCLDRPGLTAIGGWIRPA